MNITRRGFLGGMLAMAAAPAICKAENLMKIAVPSKKIIQVGFLESMRITRGCGHFTSAVDEAPYQTLDSRFGGDFDGDTVSFYAIKDQVFMNRYPVFTAPVLLLDSNGKPMNKEDFQRSVKSLDQFIGISKNADLSS